MQGNETLSLKQAEILKDNLYQILNACNRKIDTANADFLGIMISNWEDQNAVKYGNVHRKMIDQLYTTISDNYKVFVDVLNEICSAYAKAGGMTSYLPASASRHDLYRISNHFKIQDHFGDSDEFGFKDINSSSEKITQSFTDIIEKYLNQAAIDTVEKLKSVNAFGNTKVQLTLAQSAGEIVNIITATIKELKTFLNNKLDETKATYKSVGSSAETSAKISAN